jgi:YesN/AraC family two-component response regulator
MYASQDCQIETADNGARALELLSQRPFDVVVSDLMMPRIDGVELLTRVMQKHPGMVRIVVSGQAEWRNCLRSIGPAYQYLAKPVSRRNCWNKLIVRWRCGND